MKPPAAPMLGKLKRALVRFIVSNPALLRMQHKIFYDESFLETLPIDQPLIDRVLGDRHALRAISRDPRVLRGIAANAGANGDWPSLKLLSSSGSASSLAPPLRDLAKMRDEKALKRDLLARVAALGAKVSVIVPCYNYGQFVGEAVQSVLGQSYAAFEIIVIDDGSTDEETRRILSALASNRVRVLHQTNQGLAMARNNGAAEAKGDYLLFLDADDTLDEHALALMLYQFTLDPSAVAVYPSMRLFGEEEFAWICQEFNPYDLLWSNHVTVCHMIRREVFDQSKKYQPSMKFGYEDWEFALELTGSGANFLHLPIPLFNHRRHGRTMTALAHEKSEFLHAEIRRLNADLYRVERLAEIKRRWRPLVSILLSAGDHALAEGTIESIAHQTTDDYEIVSFDENNSSARNQAALASRGEFLIFLEGGETPAAETCEVLALKLLFRPDLAAHSVTSRGRRFEMVRRQAPLFGRPSSDGTGSKAPAQSTSESNDTLIEEFAAYYHQVRLGESVHYYGYRRSNTPNLFQPRRHDPKKINLLYLIPYMVVGGAERIDLDILEGLNRERFHITLAVERGGEQPWLDKFKSRVDELFILPDFLDGDALHDTFVDYLLISRNADIVFNRNTRMGYRAARRWRAPESQVRFADLLHLHNFGEDWVKVSAPYHEFIHRRYVTNDDLKNYMGKEYGHRDGRIQAVHCGVDPDVFEPNKIERGRLRREMKLSEGSEIVGFLGRFEEQKNPIKWVEVAAELRRDHSDVHFAMIGGGPLLVDAKAKAIELGIADRVYFAGFRDDIPNLLIDLDCLLLVSSHEGLPQAVLEAMSLGVSVVSSDAGGTRECVTADVGHILPIDASPKAYAEKVALVLQELRKGDGLRRKCRERIQLHFIKRRMCEFYAKEFEEMFGEVDRAKRLETHQLKLMREPLF